MIERKHYNYLFLNDYCAAKRAASGLAAMPCGAALKPPPAVNPLFLLKFPSAFGRLRNPTNWPSSLFRMRAAADECGGVRGNGIRTADFRYSATCVRHRAPAQPDAPRFGSPQCPDKMQSGFDEQAVSDPGDSPDRASSAEQAVLRPSNADLG